MKRRWVKWAQETLALKPWAERSPGEVWSRRVKPSNFVFIESLLWIGRDWTAQRQARKQEATATI